MTFNNGTCGGTDIVVPNFVNLRFCHLNTVDSRYLEVDPPKHFEISVLRRTRFVVLKKIQFEQQNFTNEYVI